MAICPEKRQKHRLRKKLPVLINYKNERLLGKVRERTGRHVFSY